MIILGIETTCDETGVAVVKARGKKFPSFKILSNVVFSQIKEHVSFGGVVPNLAARLHLKNITVVLDEALKKAKIDLRDIDLISVAQGPGLAPALFVGVETAKSLAFLLRRPLVGVNHLEGHIYSNWLEDKKISFPALVLLVSGGHTMLILVKDYFSYELLGQAKDDAVGESFDKVARLLGISYPGGPLIEKIAKGYQGDLFAFPRPMFKEDNYDFSFSGLKTAVLYKTREFPRLTKRLKNKIAASFQEAAIDVLVAKFIRAVKEYKPQSVLLAGGVAANKALRERLKKEINQKAPQVLFQAPSLSLSTDNGAMIAVAGYIYYIKKGAPQKPSLIKACPGLPLIK